MLRENAGRLEELGRTKDLAEGEQIFSQGVDYVCAIADIGVRVAAIGRLDTSVKTILFE